MKVLELAPGRLGRCLVEVGVAGAHVNHATYAAATTTPAHVHPHGNLCVLLGGRYEESWGRSTREVQPGQVVLKPPRVEHVNRFGPEDVTCLNIDFSPQAWDELIASHIREPRLFVDPNFLRLACELQVELTSPDRGSPIAAEGLLLLLVAAVLRVEPERKAGRERWLDEVRDRLHAEYALTLHLDDLAAGAGVHPAHLTRRFRRRFGRSIGEYLRGLRVAAALQGIAELDRPLAEVAHSAGFSDQSHMGRVLRRETGATPGLWRARLRSRRGATGSSGLGSF